MMLRKSFLLVCLTSIQLIAQPEWVNMKPADAAYYIGIAGVTKSDYPVDYLAVARNKALADLSSEISITIQAKQTQSLEEVNNKLSTKAASEVQSTVKASIKNYELVDTWENQQQYWVYYRLSKAVYKAERLKEYEAAVTNYLAYLEQGDGYSASKDLTSALKGYLSALAEMAPFPDSTNELMYKQKPILPIPYVKEKIARISGHLVIETEKGAYPFTLLKNQQLTIGVKVFYKTTEEQQQCGKMPIYYRYPAAKIATKFVLTTQKEGKANVVINKVYSLAKIQTLELGIDFEELLPSDSLRSVVLSLFPEFRLPTTTVQITLSPITVLVNAEENFYDNPSNEKYFEQAVRKELSSSGPFTFVKDTLKADLLVSIISDTRKGNQLYGQVITYCNVTIDVYNLFSNSGEYAFSLQDVKGVQLDETQAAIQSVQNAIKRIRSEFVPNFISKLLSR